MNKNNNNEQPVIPTIKVPSIEELRTIVDKFGFNPNWLKPNVDVVAVTHQRDCYNVTVSPSSILCFFKEENKNEYIHNR